MKERGGSKACNLVNKLQAFYRIKGSNIIPVSQT